jgi:HTH-type transcriptional regulator, competence development regulator
MDQTERKESFGEHVRSLRQARKMPIRVLAEKIGISTGYLSRIERDQYAPPSEEKIRALASVLNADPVFLLALAGKLPKDINVSARLNPEMVAQLIRGIQTMSEEDLMFWAAMWRILEDDDHASSSPEENVVSLALDRIFDRLGVKDDPDWIQKFRDLVPTIKGLVKHAEAIESLVEEIPRKNG